jgi:hypothetical protein
MFMPDEGAQAATSGAVVASPPVGRSRGSRTNVHNTTAPTMSRMLRQTKNGE